MCLCVLVCIRVFVCLCVCLCVCALHVCCLCVIGVGVLLEVIMRGHSHTDIVFSSNRFRSSGISGTCISVIASNLPFLSRICIKWGDM